MTLFNIASTTAVLSIPAFSTSARPSARAVTETTSARLMATFVRIAWPFGPMYVTFGPMACSTSATWSKASRSPPTITDISPAASVAGLPDTGQSRNDAPVARTRSASATLASGAIVLISAQTVRSRRPESTPSSPFAVASTAAVFVSIVNSTSTDAASSRGVSAQPMPARTSGSAFSLVRFQPTTSYSASSSRCAMPAPIAPRPAKPTRSIALNIASAHLARGALDRLDARLARRAGRRALQRPPQLVLAERRIDADSAERVRHRVGHGAGRPDRPALANSLRAQRVERRRRLDEHRDDRRHLRGGQQGVPDE